MADKNNSENSSENNNELIEERRDYTADTLRRSELANTPLEQFAQWLKDARARKIIDATAMMVSTVDVAGQPHSRVVLLKEFDDQGFVWYTYQESDKARQIAENNKGLYIANLVTDDDTATRSVLKWSFQQRMSPGGDWFGKKTRKTFGHGMSTKMVCHIT